MIPAITAEARKLLTIRSTYVLTALALLLAIFLAGFVQGYKLDVSGLNSNSTLQDGVMTAAMTSSIFGSLIALLVMTHEYRYNTILHSLTTVRYRLVLLAAKGFVVTLYSAVSTLLLMVVAAASVVIGVKLAGHHLVLQDIPYFDSIWRSLFYCWGYAAVGLLLGTLLRSQIAAIVVLFIVPSTLEGILYLLLKENSVYLPFSALGAVLTHTDKLSYLQAAGLFGLYLVAGWIITIFLFLRRDAN